MDRGTERESPRGPAVVRRGSSRNAYRAALVLLAARERARRDLLHLLLARGFTRSESEAALDRLSSEGYLDDRRFATGWARARLRIKPMGRYRLGRELQSKGVEEVLVREVLNELYEEGEDEAARRAMAGKLRQLGHRSIGSQAGPVARFLQRRGFSHEVVRRLLQEGEQGKRSRKCGS